MSTIASTDHATDSEDSPPQAATGSDSTTFRRSQLRRQSGILDVVNKVEVPKNLRRWPRCWACCCGVFIPLNIIVLVSLVLGLALGGLELKAEIASNDQVLRRQMADEQFSSDLDTLLVDQLPTLCLGLYNHYSDEELQQVEQSAMHKLSQVFQSILTNQSKLEPYLQMAEAKMAAVTAGGSGSSSTRADASLSNNQIVATNMTRMAQFFASCGQAAGAFRQDWQDLFFEDHDDESQSTYTKDSLSFNYIRCVDRPSPIAFNVIVVPSPQDIHDANPTTQAALFSESWTKSQQALQKEYEQHTTQLEALTKSYQEATGGEKCSVNIPSTAWFWFTVMSTVGYGNQVPVTVGGRIVTCLLGFFSILVFGAMLATTGTITTHLMNDFAHRVTLCCSKGRRANRLHIIIVWSILWCTWMLVIAFQAQSFQEIRLQTDAWPWNDAYWFAFISTTTVGFGDYYIQPEVLFVSDLVGLWGNFLVGFVFLSALLTEISGVLGSVAPDLSAELQQNLKYAYDNQGQPMTDSRRDSNQDGDGGGGGGDAMMKDGSGRGLSSWTHPTLRRTSTNNSAETPKRKSTQEIKQAARVSTPIIQEDVSGVFDVEGINDKKKKEEVEPTTAKKTKPPPKTTTTTTTTTTIKKKKDDDAKPKKEEIAKPKSQTQKQTPRRAKSSDDAIPEPRKPQRRPRRRSSFALLQEQAGKDASSPPPPLISITEPPKQKQIQRPVKPAAAKPAASKPAETPKPPPQQASQAPQQKVATFVNRGTDPAMAQAELYYQSTRWGPLGHGSAPVTVSTNTGDQWFIVANGVYAKQFIIGDGAQQQFAI